jgi:hypothetical protein
MISSSRVYVRSIQDSEDHYERPDSKGSQRGEPTPADSPGRLATAHRIYAGERLPARLPRTYPDALSVPGGQGVAGSSPAVPTVFRTLVPRNGNESGPGRSQLTRAGGHRIGLVGPSRANGGLSAGSGYGRDRGALTARKASGFQVSVRSCWTRAALAQRWPRRPARPPPARGPRSDHQERGLASGVPARANPGTQAGSGVMMYP